MNDSSDGQMEAFGLWCFGTVVSGIVAGKYETAFAFIT